VDSNVEIWSPGRIRDLRDGQDAQTCLTQSPFDVACKLLSGHPFSFNIIRQKLNEHRDLSESS
jgi:hypothetical protein